MEQSLIPYSAAMATVEFHRVAIPCKLMRTAAACFQVLRTEQTLGNSMYAIQSAVRQSSSDDDQDWKMQTQRSGDQWLSQLLNRDESYRQFVRQSWFSAGVQAKMHSLTGATKVPLNLFSVWYIFCEGNRDTEHLDSIGGMEQIGAVGRMYLNQRLYSASDLEVWGMIESLCAALFRVCKEMGWVK